MEPVVFPKHVTPVTRADRVKRAKPREDKGGGSFGKHLHQDTEEQAEGDAATEDDRELVAVEAPVVPVPVPAVSAGTPRAGGFGLDEEAKKAIDIRV
jgi:hypothetical protein